MQRLIQDTIRRALADELLFGRLVDGAGSPWMSTTRARCSGHPAAAQERQAAPPRRRRLRRAARSGRLGRRVLQVEAREHPVQAGVLALHRLRVHEEGLAGDGEELVLASAP